MTQIYASSLRETGESIKPMIAGIASVVIDVVFNYFLIYGKFGFPELGVRGAAIATLMARVVEMLVVVIWTHCKKEGNYIYQWIVPDASCAEGNYGRNDKKRTSYFLKRVFCGRAALRR